MLLTHSTPSFGGNKLLRAAFSISGWQLFAPSKPLSPRFTPRRYATPPPHRSHGQARRGELARSAASNQRSWYIPYSMARLAVHRSEPAAVERSGAGVPRPSLRRRRHDFSRLRRRDLLASAVRASPSKSRTAAMITGELVSTTVPLQSSSTGACNKARFVVDPQT